MIGLLILAGSAAAAPERRPPAPTATAATATATASVRLERSLPVNAEQWEKAPAPSRRELQRTDETGRTIRLRLIEHQ